MKNLINLSFAFFLVFLVIGFFSLLCYSAVLDNKRYVNIENQMKLNLGKRTNLMDTLLIVDYDLESEKYQLMNRNQEKSWLKKEVVEKKIIF